MKRILLFLLLVVLPSLASEGKTMVKVLKGDFEPFLRDVDDSGQDIKIEINDFYLDVYPVTNSEFNGFLKKNPKWTKSKITRAYADSDYLIHWEKDFLTKQEEKNIGGYPVSNVSWFAANAYCRSHNKKLPTINQWEYASDAYDDAQSQLILSWYENPDIHKLEVSFFQKNKKGLAGMNGYHWEWVYDFNSILLSSDSRKSKDDDGSIGFCGAGSLASRSNKDYAIFMRYAFRSALNAQYTSAILGFRCAKE